MATGFDVLASSGPDWGGVHLAIPIVRCVVGVDRAIH